MDCPGSKTRSDGCSLMIDAILAESSAKLHSVGPSAVEFPDDANEIVFDRGQYKSLEITKSEDSSMMPMLNGMCSDHDQMHVDLKDDDPEVNLRKIPPSLKKDCGRTNDGVSEVGFDHDVMTTDADDGDEKEEERIPTFNLLDDIYGPSNCEAWIKKIKEDCDEVNAEISPKSVAEGDPSEPTKDERNTDVSSDSVKDDVGSLCVAENPVKDEMIADLHVDSIKEEITAIVVSENAVKDETAADVSLVSVKDEVTEIVVSDEAPLLRDKVTIKISPDSIKEEVTEINVSIDALADKVTTRILPNSVNNEVTEIDVSEYAVKDKAAARFTPDEETITITIVDDEETTDFSSTNREIKRSTPATIAPAIRILNPPRTETNKVLKAENSSSPPTPNYRPMAKILVNIGLELLRETVYKNLIDIQMEKEKLDKLEPKEKSQLEKLQESWTNMVKKNEVYHIPTKRCRCKFATHTRAALDFHRMFGHGRTPGRYRCCYCSGFKTAVPSQFIAHMAKRHRKNARLLAFPQFQCPYCPFEHRHPVQLERHLTSCQKRFFLNRNLLCYQNIFDIPIFEAPKPKPPPVVQHVVKPIPQAAPRPSAALSVSEMLAACGISSQIQAQVLSKLSVVSQGRGQNYPPAAGARQSISISRPGQLPPNINWMHQVPGLRFSSASLPVQRAGPRSAASRPNLQHQHLQQHINRSGRPRLNSVQQRFGLLPNLPGASNTSLVVRSSVAAPVVRQTITPRQRPPAQSSSFPCEICAQPMSSMDELRVHFLTVHREQVRTATDLQLKTKTVTCKSCNERFWTKQGALRHCHMRHGMMSPRSYQCIRCGTRVTSILNHLSSQHNVTVLDMYEGRFCMLCNTRQKSLNMFESHMVSDHYDIFPNRMVLLTMVKALNAASLYKTMGKPGRPLSMQVTSSFMRQEMVNKTTKPGKMRTTPTRAKFSCHDCCLQFVTVEELDSHCENDHVHKCSRCNERWSSLEMMQRHFTAKHHSEKDPCVLCGEMVQIGRPTVRHVKRMHIRPCSVVVPRLSPRKAMRYLAKRRREIRLSSSLEHHPENAASNVSSKNGHAPAREEIRNETMNDGTAASRVEEIMEIDGETIVIKTN